MRPRPNDAKIAAVQVVAWRRLGADGRMRVAAEMSDDTRRVHVEKIRRSNPDFSENEVRRALTRTLYGEGNVPPSEGRVAAASSLALEDALARLVAVLEIAGVPFMLTGSLASTAHGVPRPAVDLDVVIEPPGDAGDALVQGIVQAGFAIDGGEATARAALAARSHFVIGDEAAAWKIDVVVKKDRPFSASEFDRRELMTVLGVRAWVPTAEDIIVAKLEWSKRSNDIARRVQQRRDVAGVVAARGQELDRAYVDRWIAALGLEDEWRIATAATP